MYQRMMDDILKQIKAGEVSGMQFKERILDKYDIACELVAFSNSQGGKLVVGIKDKTGETNALSYSEVQETTNLLSDIASDISRKTKCSTFAKHFVPKSHLLTQFKM